MRAFAFVGPAVTGKRQATLPKSVEDQSLAPVGQLDIRDPPKGCAVTCGLVKLAVKNRFSTLCTAALLDDEEVLASPVPALA